MEGRNRLSTTNPSWMVADEELDTWNDAAAEATTTASHPSYNFYNDTITIYFDQVPHVYYKKDAEGNREEIDGVTTVLDVISKKHLVPWAAKLTVETLKKYLIAPDGSINSFSTEELLGWLDEAKRAHKDKLNTAGNIGTLAHNAIEEAIKHAIAHTHGIVQVCPTVNPASVPNVVPTPEEIGQAQTCANAGYAWMVAHSVVWLHTERKIYSREYNFSGTLDGDALISSCTDRYCKGCRGRIFEARRAITDWKCLLPSQTLLKVDGSKVSAKDVTAGDQLTVYDEGSMRFTSDIVKSVISGGVQPSVEVVTMRGRRVKASSNHPFLIAVPDGQVWVEAGELRKGDAVLVFNRPFAGETKVSVDTAALLGYLIGDGGFSDKYSRTVTKQCPVVYSRIAALCDKHEIGIKPNGKHGSEKGHYNLSNAGAFARLHGFYCKKSVEKAVPASIMSGGRDAAVAFLSALFDCDGYVSKLGIGGTEGHAGRIDVCFHTSSERLAEDILELLHRLGVNAHSWKQHNKKYKGVIHKYPPFWVKTYSRGEGKKLLSLLQLTAPEKVERQRQWLEELEAVRTPEYDALDYVKEVRSLGSVETVAVEMANVPTFVTSGIVTHNTSNQLSDSYAYQTSAYQFAHLEEFPDLYIPDRWIMRLGKTEGDFECWYLPAEHFEKDFDAFLAALQLYRSLDEIESRRANERKEFNTFVRAAKRAEKEAAEEADKASRAAERERLKLAKQWWDDGKKQVYKLLRKQVSKAEAEAMVDVYYPKSSRPGAKDEVIVETKVAAVAKVVAATTPTAANDEVTWATTSGHRVIKIEETPEAKAPVTVVSQSGRRFIKI